MKFSLKKRSAAIAAAAVAVATVSQGMGMSPANAATDINVMVFPVQTSTTGAAYALSQGIFAKNGLNATIVVGGANDVVNQLAAGKVQFSYMPIMQALQARTNAGVDLKIVGVSDGISPNDAKRSQTDKKFALIADPTILCVNPSLKLTSPKQLEGKTVAVSARQGFAELAISTTIRKAGGDPKKVNWVVLGPGVTVAAIKAGKVDGAYVSAPYSGQCIAEGLQPLASPSVTVLTAGGPITAWVTTAAYAKANPAVVTAFQKSMYQTAVAIRTAANMKTAITESTKYTKVPVETALAIPKMPFYFSTTTKANIDVWAKELQRNGLVAKPVDVAGALLPQPKSIN